MKEWRVFFTVYGDRDMVVVKSPDLVTAAFQAGAVIAGHEGWGARWSDDNARVIDGGLTVTAVSEVRD